MLNNYQKKIERPSKDKEYYRMIWDERIEETLRRHDDYFNGKYEGIEIGKSEGIQQNRTEMIINLYKNGVSIELISKSSGLSIQEVEKIIKNSQLNNN